MGFNKDFYWGGSVSSFQTEGAWDEGGKGLSIYDVRPTNPNFSDNHPTTSEKILIKISIILPNIHVTEFATFNFDCFIFFTHRKNAINELIINITLNVIDIFNTSLLIFSSYCSDKYD